MLFFLTCDSGQIVFLFFGAMWFVGSQFCDQGSNPGPQQWKHKVLTREFPSHSFLNVYVAPKVAIIVDMGNNFSLHSISFETFPSLSSGSTPGFHPLVFCHLKSISLMQKPCLIGLLIVQLSNQGSAQGLYQYRLTTAN